MIDFEAVLSRISLGAFHPTMRVAAVKVASVAAGIDGVMVPIEQPGIIITMRVTNADAPESTLPVTLCQSFPRPPSFQSESEVAEWVLACVEKVLLHELYEFFQLDGVKVKPPKHPIV